MGLLATTQAGAQEVRSPAFQVLNEVRIEQRIGEQVPLDAIFRNSIGETVKLGDLVQGRPVILSAVYYECPMHRSSGQAKFSMSRFLDG